MKHRLIICYSLSLVLLFSCAGKTNSTDNSQPVAPPESDSVSVVKVLVFPYNLLSPDEKFTLPDALKEISGIDVYRKSKLVCVQDEKGKVYVYDVKKGELKEGFDFGSKGDYEGVANVNDTIWVLSSNGNLQRIIDFTTPNQKTDEFKTPLNEENDTEGLCYDKKNNRLLIACKAKAGTSLKGVRAIYGFDLKTNAITAAPAYTIKVEDIRSFLAQHDKEKFVTNELRSLLDSGNGDVTFQPSDVHIHPVTDDLYIISSVGNLLLVLSRNNTIKYITKLDPDIFKQPEGITFMDDGTMFISDEGRDGKGNILKFSYKPNVR